MNRVLVIGISGATNGGKTKLTKLLQKAMPWAKALHQDDYFFPENSTEHRWLLKPRHVNWEIISALDMKSMWRDANKAIEEISSVEAKAKSNGEKISDCSVDEFGSSIESVQAIRNLWDTPVLLLDGFTLFAHRDIAELCHLKYFYTLDKEECKRRRNIRTYVPADPPGYFDACIWPEHVRYKAYVEQNVTGVTFLDGTPPLQESLKKVLPDILNALLLLRHRDEGGKLRKRE